MFKKITFSLIAFLLSQTVMANTDAVNQLMQSYASTQSIQPSAEKGQQLWNKEFSNSGKYAKRSCSTCHKSNISLTGKHVNTGKLIQPMSVVSNPKRYTNVKKIKKWFKRNCKWTLGRECSAEEKASFLLFLNQ
ncbi:MAG: DUF1924 domain-containing protein [Gammaproteobacteria bacterium]|nr:DUF1924 domain-containing protein [Gammaproteobacteria bacterium]